MRSPPVRDEPASGQGSAESELLLRVIDQAAALLAELDARDQDGALLRGGLESWAPAQMALHAAGSALLLVDTPRLLREPGGLPRAMILLAVVNAVPVLISQLQATWIRKRIERFLP